MIDDIDGFNMITLDFELEECSDFLDDDDLGLPRTQIIKHFIRNSIMWSFSFIVVNLLYNVDNSLSNVSYSRMNLLLSFAKYNQKMAIT